MRRVLIMAGAAGVAILLSAAIMLMPPAAEFDFLSGYTPVSASLAEERGTPTNARTRFVVYSIRTDYLKLLARAEAELNKRGYDRQMIHSSRSATFLRNRVDPNDITEAEAVMFLSDTKFEGNRAPRGVGGDEGWVSIQIIGGAKRSWVERFRSWIGV